jgi:aminoglycoside phosphotransferase (APT) family kinase protein
MTGQDLDTIEVRPEEQIDTVRLEPYLRERLPEVDGALEVRQFGGGHANLTYLIRFGAREWVLRRPPLGPVPPSAHDMRREHRVLSTLYRGFPQAPRSYLLCTDHAIIGADFFVMERRHGIVIRVDVPEPWRSQSGVLRGVGETLIDDLAALHAIEPASVGLGDLGNPEGYLERQLTRWIERWYNALTPDVGPGEPLIGWVRQSMPAPRRTVLLHNDYKLDNTLRDADDPARTVAILDWDMCTRGEALMDLGELLALWVERTEPPVDRLGRMPTWREGFPTRREAAERYALRSGADLSDLRWYVVFNVFRYAVILQQIYLRYSRGQTHDERFADFGERINALMAHGLDLIESGEF